MAFSLCSTLDGTQALHKELAFYSAIAAVLRKHGTTDKKRTEDQKNSALKQILDNAVKAEDVQDIFQMAGLEKPNIGLLSDEFLEDVRRMDRKNLAVEQLERLLKDKIKARGCVLLPDKNGGNDWGSVLGLLGSRMQPFLGASELIEKLRNSTTVDWQFRESVRARMRLLIKQLLRKYKYPPGGYEESIALVLRQAEELAGAWTEEGC